MKLSNTVLLYKMEREKAMYWLSTKKAKIIMLLPTLMIYAVFIIIPVFIAIYYSFTDYSGLGKASFVGIKNYIARTDNRCAFRSCISRISQRIMQSAWCHTGAFATGTAVSERGVCLCPDLCVI